MRSHVAASVHGPDRTGTRITRARTQQFSSQHNTTTPLSGLLIPRIEFRSQHETRFHGHTQYIIYYGTFSPQPCIMSNFSRLPHTPSASCSKFTRPRRSRAQQIIAERPSTVSEIMMGALGTGVNIFHGGRGVSKAPPIVAVTVWWCGTDFSSYGLAVGGTTTDTLRSLRPSDSGTYDASTTVPHKYERTLRPLPTEVSFVQTTDWVVSAKEAKNRLRQPVLSSCAQQTVIPPLGLLLHVCTLTSSCPLKCMTPKIY